MEVTEAGVGNGKINMSLGSHREFIYHLCKWFPCQKFSSVTIIFQFKLKDILVKSLLS